MNNQTISDLPPVNTVNTDAADGAAKKGGCRRSLGWGLLACGLLVLIAGGGGATWANLTAQPSTFWTCQSADRDKAKADANYEELKKRGLDNINFSDKARIASLPVADQKAMSDFDSSLKTSSNWQSACTDDINSRRGWRNIFLVVAAIGLFGTLSGYLLKR